MSMNCILLVDGRRVDVADLIGCGIDGFVIRNGCHALKIPKLLGRLRPDGKIEAHSDNDLYLEHLEGEKRIYERLREVSGVATCIEQTSNGILLEYYRNGSLDDYIACHASPSMAWKWHWALQATEIIARCHDKGVLVFDIALRNFLLADDFSLRIIDFTNSSLLPQDEDITRVNVDGCTAGLDLLHLSNVIYSIMTWQRFSIDCAMVSEWPNTNQIPNLEGSEYAQMIQKCWERRYTAIQELEHDLRLCANASPSAATPENQNPRDIHLPVNVQSSSPALPPT